MKKFLVLFIAVLFFYSGPVYAEKVLVAAADP